MTLATVTVTAVLSFVFWNSMSRDFAQWQKEREQRNVMDLFGSLKDGKLTLSLNLQEDGVYLTSPIGTGIRHLQFTEVAKALSLQKGEIWTIMQRAGDFLVASSGIADRKVVDGDSTDVQLGDCWFRFARRPAQQPSLRSIRCTRLPEIQGLGTAGNRLDFEDTRPKRELQPLQQTAKPQAKRTQKELPDSQIGRFEGSDGVHIAPPDHELSIACGSRDWQPFRRLIGEFCLRHPSSDCTSAVALSASCHGAMGDVPVLHVPANKTDFDFALEGEEGVALVVYFAKQLDSWTVTDVKTVGE
jgi:hypothetical protein